MASEISSTDNIIDSRDVIARYEELRDEAQACSEPNEMKDWIDSNYDEWSSLHELMEEGESVSDWSSGTTLINEKYWSDYCEELCEDIDGSALANLPDYIKNNINWDSVADTLQADYTEVTFDGTTFYVRS